MYGWEAALIVGVMSNDTVHMENIPLAECGNCITLKYHIKYSCGDTKIDSVSVANSWAAFWGSKILMPTPLDRTLFRIHVSWP